MKTTGSIVFVCALLSTGTMAETSGRFDMAAYWLMPSNLVARTCNVTWAGDIIFGEHCFWNGAVLGRNCFLQGDPSMTRYDVFEPTDTSILYWGTFRGNSTNDAVTHSFDSPMLWMRHAMSIGDKLESRVFVRVLNPGTRSTDHQGMVDMRIELDEHHKQWTLPETGVSYDDVIKVSFWSDASRPESREVYHLAKGKGTIRFVSSNRGEPSGVRVSWVVGFEKKAPNRPTLPWCELFGDKGKRANKQLEATEGSSETWAEPKRIFQ